MVLNKIPTFNEVKTWVNNNADVPNADHADDSDTLQGNAPDELGGLDYIQDTEPSSPTDGEAWADTSTSLRTLYIYSADRGEWVPTFESVPLFVTQEAITFGESEATVTGFAAVEGGAVTTPPRVDSVTSRTVDDLSNNYGESGLVLRPNSPLTAIEANISANNAAGSRTVRITTGDGSSEIVSKSVNVGPGDTIRLEANLSAGVEYRLLDSTAGDMGYYNQVSFPFESTALDLINGIQSGNEKPSQALAFNDVRGEYTAAEGDEVAKTVGWTVPDDLAAWDRLTAQSSPGDGKITLDVETDDGSGWSTYAADVAVPYSIASIPADTDVRIVARLSHEPAGGTRPQVPYVARRGER